MPELQGSDAKMPPSLEESMERACRDKIIPGAVLMACNKSGSFNYSKVFGSLSVKDCDASKPLPMNAIFMLASLTKLMTSVAVLQCVERGLIGLDDRVENVLPDLAELDVLTGFEKSGKPIMKKRHEPILLRQLLTHTVGLSYDSISSYIRKLRKVNKDPGRFGPTLAERFKLPLLFEPGSSWIYGSGLDWAGRLVERLTKKTLEDYMKENIWDPLGCTDLTFWPDSHPEMEKRLSSFSLRDPTGFGKVVHYDSKWFINEGLRECLGGQGLYGSMPDYMKILRSLMVDDEILLKKETTAMMFTPQLSPKAMKDMNDMRGQGEVWSMFVGYFPPHISLDWGIGGIITREDDPGWRKRHTMTWSGIPNLFWFIDRETGLCGAYGGQVLPTGDAQTGELITLFEKTMYERSAEAERRTNPKAKL